MNPISAILGVFNSVTNAYSNNQKIKAAVRTRKDELTQTKVDAKIKRIADGDMSDIEQDDNARGFAGWMDDISFFIFILPIPLSFFPFFVPHIQEGFLVLKGMPVEYQCIIAMMLASVWGYKRVINPVIIAFTKKWF